MRNLLQQKSIVVLCGSGGVGKTTLSAALALMGALEGRRSLVLTVDPAGRLSQVMGLKKLEENRPRLIPRTFFARAGLHPAGSLSAVRIDTRSAFDRIIEKTAPSPAVSERILTNPIYDHMAGYMTGSHELVAMDKVLEFYQSGQYDLLVLDTPPTRYALNFLDAPGKLLNFLDDSVLQWFIKPAVLLGKFPLKLFSRGPGFHLGFLERFTGAHILRHLVEFCANFSEMSHSFKERATQVRAVLGSDRAAFVLAAAPSRVDIWENRFFCQRLLAESMPLAYVVVNRVRPLHGYPDALPQEPSMEDLHEALKHAVNGEALTSMNLQRVMEKLKTTAELQRRLAQMDSDAIRLLKEQLPPHLRRAFGVVPLVEERINNARALHTVGKHLVNIAPDDAA